MNNLYVSKVVKIKNDMLRVAGDPCSELRRMLEGCRGVFSLKAVPHIKTAKKMRKTISMRRDDIPADLFFFALPSMRPAVMHIINLSLTLAQFPKKWKISKICPLHKGGDKHEPNQFRPVALIPIITRLLEKIVCEQLMTYENDLLHSQNHRYWKGPGITSAVIEEHQAALEAITDGDIMGMVTLNHSAAFNVVESLEE